MKNISTTEKKSKVAKKKEILAIIVVSVIVISGGGLSLYLVLRPPIPRDAEYAHIFSANHAPSMNIHNPLTINLTFTFANGVTMPTIYQRFHTRSLRLELLLWRPNTGQFPVYVVQNMLYNVSFTKVGEWTIEINLGHRRSNSTAFIWDYTE